MKKSTTQKPLLKRSIMLLAKVFLVGIFLVSQLGAFAQQKTLTGSVVDTDGTPIVGVTVVVEGTTVGTVSDIDGNYTLDVPANAEALLVSYIGMKAQRIVLGSETTINITMEPDNVGLDEVVVVGYGSQRKRDLTAAIASVEEAAIQKIPAASAMEALQGQVSGVDVVTKGGRPGEESIVRIRGRRSLTASNNPLYVIDGIPMASGSIFDINPKDIVSMEVLKDAAASAIYGSRGANGVIIVTTKRGKEGKTQVSYNGYYGISTMVNKVDMMNGEEFANMKRESRRYDPATNNVAWDGIIPPDFVPDENGKVVFDDPIEEESINADYRWTDYQDMVSQQGYQTNHQVSVAGGGAKTNFNISLGYFDEEGLVKNQDYNRTTLRVNLDHKINDIFKVGISSHNSYSIQNWGSDATWGEAIANNPLGVPYNEDGSVRFLPTNDGIRTNPLAEIEPGAYVDENRTMRTFTSGYLEANIAKGLQYKLLAGVDIRERRNGRFRGSLTNAKRGGPADARFRNWSDLAYTIENLITYDRNLFEDHKLKVTLLHSVQAERDEWHYTEVANLPYESQLFYNMGTGEVKGAIETGLRETSLMSYMGRINYDIRGKYLLQGTLRADGSSRLAEENKWQYFPGASAGWRIIEEGFMQDVNFLDELKLRASYGSVGNQSISPYQTWGRLARTTYSWNDNDAAFGYRLDEVPNPDLGWEVSSTVDIGLEFGLFDGLLNGTFDWYQTNTTDLLLERKLPYTSGYQEILQNIGATRTQGLEFSLIARIFDKPNDGFKWNINWNISSYQEEIVELVTVDEDGNPTDDVGSGWFIGEAINVYYDYEKTGIWQIEEAQEAQDFMNAVPGEIKLKDQDGDGSLTPDDRVILGTDVPDFMGGLTSNMSFKGFDFSFFFYYRMGHLIRSSFHTSNNSLFARYNNYDVDYWTLDNPTNDAPRPNENQERPKYNSTMQYFDGSFVKLRNVTLGYNLPKSWIEKAKLSNVRVYAQAQNPWYWSKYESYDPELGSEASDSDTDDIGSNDMPVPSYWIFGVSIDF